MAGEKVLVVEDNAVNLELVVDLLTSVGYVVFQAEDAERGIELARAHRPALVLMDIALPSMDGLHATVILKRDRLTHKIPVIALTAHAMKSDEEKAYAVGCDGFITKPIQTRTFLAQIADFIKPEPRRKPARAA